MENVFEDFKNDFAHLTSFKQHPESIEIQTPLATVTDKFVHVFVKRSNNVFIVSDGGWIERNMYDVDYGIDKDIMKTLCKKFEIDTGLNSIGETYYIVRVEKREVLTSYIFRVAHFIQFVVNFMAISQPLMK